MFSKYVCAFVVFTFILKVNTATPCTFIWCSSKDGINEKIAKLQDKTKTTELLLKSTVQNQTELVRDSTNIVKFELAELKRFIDFYAKRPTFKDNEVKRTCLNIIMVKLKDYNHDKAGECASDMVLNPLLQQISSIKLSLRSVTGVCKTESSNKSPNTEQCVLQKLEQVEISINSLATTIEKDGKMSKGKLDRCLKGELNKINKLKREFNIC